MRALLTVLAVTLIAARESESALPGAQSIRPQQNALLSARAMSALFPKSQSPASFRVAPMPKTALLSPSAFSSELGRSGQSADAMQWARLSADTSQVAVAPDGSLWVLSDEPRGSIDKRIWHYRNGMWTNVSGVGSSIAVGPGGTVYVVDGTSTGIWAYSGSSWRLLGGGARSIATGLDGSIYVLSSTNVVNGDSAIWKYEAGAWAQQPGLGSKLSNSFDPSAYEVAGVGRIVPNGYFLLNASGGIYYYSPGVGYVRFPGTANGVAAVPGGLFELASRKELVYFDYAAATAMLQPGYGVAIAAEFGGAGTGAQLYAIDSFGVLWREPARSMRFNDYSTFGYDNQRDVFNPNSTAITPASMPGLHLAWQAALAGGNDFTTQTQPVVATEIPGHSGVLFVGGGTGNVYAYDATSGALIWTKNLGQVADACGPSSGFFGVGGSVAYDPATRSLYAIGNVNASFGAYAKDTLYHLDAATGAVLGSVVFTPTAAGSNEIDVSHTSVTLSHGTAYVGTGSFCDTSSWRGRVVAINVPSMTIAHTFFTVWDPQNARGQGAQPWGGGGVWGWGGVSLDRTGHVFTAVGNGDIGDGYGTIAPPFVAMPLEYDGYADALLELSGNLSTVLASNHPTPANYYSFSGNIDQQGTPVVFTPFGCGTMLAGQGKSGELSLYDESSLSRGPVAQYQMSPSSAAGQFIGEPAYSPATQLVYSNVMTSAAPSLFDPGMVAVNPGCGHPSVAWRAAFGSSTDQLRSVPAASAGGVVFAGAGNAVWALDATTGAILNRGQPFAQTGAAVRMPATIDGDWVYIIDNNGNLYAYTTDYRFAAIRATAKAFTARQRWRWTERRHD